MLLGRMSSPPTTSCQIVAMSPAIACATIEFARVGSICAAPSDDSEEPPTSKLKGCVQLYWRLVRPLPISSLDPPSPSAVTAVWLASAVST